MDLGIIILFSALAIMSLIVLRSFMGTPKHYSPYDDFEDGSNDGEDASFQRYKELMWMNKSLMPAIIKSRVEDLFKFITGSVDMNPMEFYTPQMANLVVSARDDFEMFSQGFDSDDIRLWFLRCETDFAQSEEEMNAGGLDTLMLEYKLTSGTPVQFGKDMITLGGNDGSYEIHLRIELVKVRSNAAFRKCFNCGKIYDGLTCNNCGITNNPSMHGWLINSITSV